MGIPVIPPSKNINFTINKLTREQFLQNSDYIRSNLSDEVFMTTDDVDLGSNNILYMPQEQYDGMPARDPSQYYATPGPDPETRPDDYFININNIDNYCFSNFNNYIYNYFNDGGGGKAKLDELERRLTDLINQKQSKGSIFEYAGTAPISCGT